MILINESYLKSKAIVSETGCWLWQRATSSGYGVAWDSAKLHKVHRLMFEIANGPIPPGMEVCHRCDTPACFNPEHLFLGTHRDNMRDAITKGRFVFPTYRPPLWDTCKRGHQMQGDNLYVRPSGKRCCKQCHNLRIYRKQPAEPAK